MREIKFRGIRVDNGDWVYGDLVHVVGGKIAITRKVLPISVIAASDYFVQVLPESVGQFTGLKDSKGVEIYEGDIARFYEEKEENWFFGLAKIVWKAPGFKWDIIKYDGIDLEILDSTAFWNDDFEIIGNVHQHKQLMEGKCQ